MRIENNCSIFTLRWCLVLSRTGIDMVRRLLFFGSLLVFNSCTKNESAPSWLKIDHFDLTSIAAFEGENSQNITDAWIYMDGQAIGVFELPCKVPILAEGTHNFTIYAGVKENGISDTRVKYPFYTSWQGDIDLVKDDTVEVNPDITYKSGLNFSLLEDFEDAGIDLGADPISDTPFVFIYESIDPDIVEWGDKCGGVFLTATDTLFKALTSLDMDLPQGGSPVWLEIDYMNSNSIAMGVIDEGPSGTNVHGLLVLLNSQEASQAKWKKIYINLTDDVSYYVSATSFEIYLLALLDDANPSGAFIYMDNIKIVHQ